MTDRFRLVYQYVIMIYALIAVIFLGLMFGPQMWVRYVIAEHADDRPDFPGTGGKPARLMLDEAGLDRVPVDALPADGGDHYDPVAKALRLRPSHHDGRSITAVAITAHEVSHAMQDGEGYRPLALRTRMSTAVQKYKGSGRCC